MDIPCYLCEIGEAYGMECKHEKLKEIYVAVIAGVLNRKMTVCEDCGKVIKVDEYEVD